jgi:heterodisulfide reductase subunit B
LNEVLDETAQAGLREELDLHLRECPNCWVVCDTTKKTIEVYRGLEPLPIPESTHARLIEALEKKFPPQQP